MKYDGVDMFKTKEDFKREYQQRMIEKYGVEVNESHIYERYEVLGSMVRDFANFDWRKTHREIIAKQKKQLIYFSMEFLIGRLLVNNMMNLGVYKVAQQGLKDLGINIHELEELESDAGLGNGGLGRLAACFLDSIASLGYPGHGNCIRYDYGFFRQKIVNGKQKELPDQWLSNGYVWEVKKPKHCMEVKFYGNPETYLKPNGEYGIKTVNAVCVRATPYDVNIVGYKNHVCDTLRLWGAEPSQENLPKNQSFDDYLSTLKELTFGLYPDDTTEHGRMLRLRQQYFLVSAGMQCAVKSHLSHYGTLDNFADKIVVQLNDTHPILAIPELMRILLDDYEYSWDDAWRITKNCMAFTNHTVMPEALEKWPVNYVQQLIPRCFMIIEEINRRFNLEMNEKGVDDAMRWAMQIVKDGQIHMCNLAIYTCFSVNGVAALHTEILKTQTFKDFYKYMPEKFNNKTNGVTHRRWLLNCNNELAELINSKIGEDYHLEFSKIAEFKKFAEDKEVLKKLAKIKYDNKVKLAAYVKEHNGLDIDPHSIFDVQIKRLHAYKRQLMNIFHIIYLYQRMKNDSSFRIYPRTFIFGAKAAPSYAYAKKIIELILAVADVVNNDEETNRFLKVVFIENYGVTLAELIIPAADVSEQISTAGKEASGTSNMKFMMNGAITLGTLDGANIEIAQNAGEENCVIFGLKEKEVDELKKSGSYSPWDVYNSDYRIKCVMDSLLSGPWCGYHQDRFKMIFDEVMYHYDEYLILKDFDSYVKAQEKIETLYQDKNTWQKMACINIASSGFFSSDRTIEQYVHDIWHLEKLYK